MIYVQLIKLRSNLDRPVPVPVGHEARGYMRTKPTVGEQFVMTISRADGTLKASDHVLITTPVTRIVSRAKGRTVFETANSRYRLIRPSVKRSAS